MESLLKEKYGNGTHTEYSYDPARRWLSTIKTQIKNGVPFQNMSYEFDLVGNCLDGGRGLLTKKIEPKGIVLTNQYDACGRLKSETRTFGEMTEIKSYDYDENGFMYYASDNGVVSYINYANGIYKANAYDLVTSLETTVLGKKLNTGSAQFFLF